MGRIRKALSAASFIATAGTTGWPGAPVRWKSSAEQAADEQTALLRQIAGQGESEPVSFTDDERAAGRAAFQASLRRRTEAAQARVDALKQTDPS
jgi:hypothetical protein